MGTKKRRHMPHELFGRFSAKSDFIKYFKENRKPFSFRLTFTVQSNFTCLPSICSTKIFSNKSSSRRKVFWNCMKSNGFVFLCMTNYQSSNCGRWWEQMRSSCGIFLRKWRRVEFLIESISSTCWTLFKATIFSSWSNMLNNNETQERQRQRQKKWSRSMMTGGKLSTAFLLFRVSKIFYFQKVLLFICSLAAIFVLCRTQRQNSSLAQSKLEACSSVTKTTQDWTLGNLWRVQVVTRRTQTRGVIIRTD